MRLTSVAIQGFKSFARPTHLTFGPGVTGVIGPNGSGKSNVAEAIRWVLGEQSMKALRGKERSDVIYSGDAKHASRAQVTLLFDNTSGRFPISANEIAITRTLSRAGESKYTINNEAVRLIDLQQMLAEAGIGAKSYTVISQGMIDQYLTANPEGRRELFNEATGIKSLQIKIVQSQQKIKKAQEHALEVQTILDELRPRLTFLQRQIDRYDERDNYLAAYTEKQLAYYHAAWHANSAQPAGTHQQLKQIHQRIISARAHRITAEKQVLSAASAKNPQAALEQELLSERARYTLALEQWKRNEQEKEELTRSLAQIAEQRRRTAATLNRHNDTSASVDIRSTLLACKDFLDQIMHDIIPPKPVAKRVLGSIIAILRTPTTPLAEESPQILLVRLSAIEEERTAQLQRLPSITKPSDAEIQRIQHVIEKLGITTPIPSSDNLEQARQAELQAEREEASLTALLDQQTQSVAALEQEILRECGSAALEHIQTSPSKQETAVTEQELRALAAKIATIGERDELVATEHAETKARFDGLSAQFEDVQQTMQRIAQSIDEVSSTMKINFARKFSEITEHFSKYFTLLFGGGSATLEATEQGIEISVIPPGKRSRHITLLSGGERALTSIALLFAILDAQKPPFIVLDEVDAALDEANSHRFAKLLREHSARTQSIVISHNRETMSQSDLLYGVTMHKNGISTLYSVKILDYVEQAPEAKQMPV
ncbi:MAG: hypothetical protein A3E36_02905 [Candidatus Andersenbacteria bacterium RIFCSPHIGHO2_12_FULL_45_11b]|uniref:RecF/RecN/SMC N-terminal domain-containing protein n=1 Tax=Candidatus Andersenbacteria bacterium RIFCSPHIGHO2_12_FULL_45_11b TaxID=1797282 RepID=A0A1G1XBK9_9BACT|nr:MAG: hypothetical protein A3E36_02905 [Candidatus Andersenbacteria bacterium RIFCSPHIGHO2_12_FULL_45_11b]